MRTRINPTNWGQAFRKDQAHLVTAPGRLLFIAGQTATDEHGTPLGGDDVAAQLTTTLDNLERVLADAGMGLGDLVRLTVHATDVDATLAAWGGVVERLPAGVPMTLVGVTRLALPDAVVEIDGIAAQ
jgi:enamine deaminase RidA (YjgF/YER057c/UK114 family)